MFRRPPRLGQAEVVDVPQSSVNIKRAGPDIVKFCFKYRPIDVLRANGIAPPPPQLKRKASAEPPPRAQTPDDSEALADLEEARILREKLRALEAKLSKREKKPRIKEEPGAVVDLTQGSSRSKSKRVKLEEKRPFIPGEVIDLT